MEIMTSWKQEGYEIGKREGEANLLIELLSFRFAKPNETIQQEIRNLAEQNLVELSKAIFAFNNITDLQDWLNNHKQI